MFRRKRKIKVCQNHLPEFYEALKDGNLSRVKKVEHELTSEEECVACTYLLKARGEAKEEAESYLAQEGFIRLLSKKSITDFWLVRLFIFFVVLGIVFTVEFTARGLVKSFLGFKDQLNIFTPRPLEWGAVLLISLLVYFKLEQ